MSISKYLKKNMDIDGKSEEMIFFKWEKIEFLDKEFYF